MIRTKDKILFFLLLLLFLPGANLFPQISKASNSLFDLPNRLKFGNYLFCTRDYLRAVEEYRTYLKHKNNDTVQFKIGLAYEAMKKYGVALMYFDRFPKENQFFPEAKLELYKTIFLSGNYNQLRNRYSRIHDMFKYYPEVTRLNYLSFLFDGSDLPDSSNFKLWFNLPEHKKVMKFYYKKINLPHKSLTVAGVLSALIPGLGKIYAGEIGDGITAFIFNGILGFLAYDNFKAGHKTRGWIFSGLTAFFYAGNIYGSVAAAQIYNKKVKVDYKEELKKFLERENYFLPDYKFLCK